MEVRVLLMTSDGSTSRSFPFQTEKGMPKQDCSVVIVCSLQIAEVYASFYHPFSISKRRRKRLILSFLHTFSLVIRLSFLSTSYTKTCLNNFSTAHFLSIFVVWTQFSGIPDKMLLKDNHMSWKGFGETLPRDMGSQNLRWPHIAGRVCLQENHGKNPRVIGIKTQTRTFALSMTSQISSCRTLLPAATLVSQLCFLAWSLHQPKKGRLVATRKAHAAPSGWTPS